MKRLSKLTPFKRAFVLFIGIIAIFVFLNLTIYTIFLNRTYPNTEINNHTIGSIKYDKLSNKISSLYLNTQKIDLKDHNHTSSFIPSQLGIEVHENEIISKLKKRSFLPIVNFFIPHNALTLFNINYSTLNKRLTDLSAIFARTPINATISKQNSKFILISSTDGYKLNSSLASSEIISAVEAGKFQILLPDTVILPPITNINLEPQLQKLTAEQSVKITYTLNGKTYSPTSDEITGWYELTNNSYVIQSSKVYSYIAQLGVNNNIHIQNLADTVTSTTSAIRKTIPVNITIIPAATTVCSSNSLGHLVIVSIGQQHMWICQSYNLVYESVVTTGAYQILGDATPTGSWYIYGKQQNIYLTGPTWNDFVNYWLPFYGPYGFHDSSWQTFPYGTDAYATQGSHGCVHLPGDAMKWLYNWATIGTTVTVTN